MVAFCHRRSLPPTIPPVCLHDVALPTLKEGITHLSCTFISGGCHGESSGATQPLRAAAGGGRSTTHQGEKKGAALHEMFLSLLHLRILLDFFSPSIRMNALIKLHFTVSTHLCLHFFSTLKPNICYRSDTFNSHKYVESYLSTHLKYIHMRPR